MNNKTKRITFHGTASAFYAVMLFTFFTHKHVILVERMITTWYLALQITFVFLRLLEDLFINHSKAKDWKLTNILSKINNLMFISLIFPFALYIPLVYWLLFYYNSNLIHPNFLEISLPSWVSTSSHSAIAVVALVEMLTTKYSYEGNYLSSLVILVTFTSSYVVCLVGTYLQYGFWLYPLFHLFSSSTLPYVFILLGVLLVFMFFVGGMLSNFFDDWNKKTIKNALQNSSKCQGGKYKNKFLETLKNMRSIFKKVHHRPNEKKCSLCRCHALKKEQTKLSDKPIAHSGGTLNQSFNDDSHSSLNSSDISELNIFSNSSSSDDENSTNAAYGSGGETAINRHMKALVEVSSGKPSESESHLSSSTKKSKLKKSKQYSKKNPFKTLCLRLEFLSRNSSRESIISKKTPMEKSSNSLLPKLEHNQKTEFENTSKEKILKKNYNSGGINSGEDSKIRNAEEDWPSNQIELNLQMKKKDKLLLEKIVNKSNYRKKSITDSEKSYKKLKTIFLKVMKMPTKTKTNRKTSTEEDTAGNDFLKNSINIRPKIDIPCPSEVETTMDSSKAKSSAPSINKGLKNSFVKKALPRVPEVTILKPSTKNHETLLDDVNEVAFTETVNDVNGTSMADYLSPQVLIINKANTEEPYSTLYNQVCGKYQYHSSRHEKKSPIKKDEKYTSLDQRDQPIPSTSGIDMKTLLKNKEPLSPTTTPAITNLIGTKQHKDPQNDKSKKRTFHSRSRSKTKTKRKLLTRSKSKENRRESGDEKMPERKEIQKKKNPIESENKARDNLFSKTAEISEHQKIKEKHKQSSKIKTDGCNIIKTKNTDDQKDVYICENKIASETTYQRKKRHPSNEPIQSLNKYRLKATGRQKIDSDSTTESLLRTTSKKKKNIGTCEYKPKQTDEKCKTFKKHEPKENSYTRPPERNTKKQEHLTTEIIIPSDHERVKNSLQKSKNRSNKSKPSTLNYSNTDETLKVCQSSSSDLPHSPKKKFLERLFTLPKIVGKNTQRKTTKVAKNSLDEPQIEAVFSVIPMENKSSNIDNNIRKLLHNLETNEESPGNVNCCKFYAKLLCHPPHLSDEPEGKTKNFRQPPYTHHNLSYMDELRQTIRKKSLSQCSQCRSK